MHAYISLHLRCVGNLGFALLKTKPSALWKCHNFLLKMWKQCVHGCLCVLLMLRFFFFLGKKCVFHKLYSFLEFRWYCVFKWTTRGNKMVHQQRFISCKLLQVFFTHWWSFNRFFQNNLVKCMWLTGDSSMHGVYLAFTLGLSKLISWGFCSKQNMAIELHIHDLSEAINLNYSY